MISMEQAAEIRRLYFAEHWRKGTIVSHLGVHPDVVERVIGATGRASQRQPPLPNLLDPYKDFVEETLEKYPRLTSTRLYDMLRGRGYAGSIRTLTRYVANVRPTPKSEAFVRIERLPGEQAQVDWGYISKIPVLGGERALWVFVLVLAYSRAVFAELVFDLTVHSLLRSLLRSALFFGGVTRQWLFDNPKTVVVERSGDLVRYHADLLDFTARMHVQPRLCGVRKPHQKGGVERAIRYLKDRFFAARKIHSIEQGNAQLQQFIETTAMERRHPIFEEKTVAEVLEDEKQHLLGLPDPLPEVDLVTTTRANKTCLVTFDRNRYSVPPVDRRRPLTLVASDVWVRILDGQVTLAEHRRCWGRKQTVEDPEHRKAILEAKPGAKEGQGRQRLVRAIPQFEKLMEHWVSDGRNLGSMVARSLKLLDLHGVTILASAVESLLEKGSHDLGALAILCEQLRRPGRRRLPMPLGDHVPERDVIGHDLGGYDDD